MRKTLTRLDFGYFIHGSCQAGKLCFLSSLRSLNKEAAIKQIQDFKQLRNEKKMLEKEFKKTQVRDDTVRTRRPLAPGALGLPCE